VETFDALAIRSRQVSRSAQMQAVSVSCQITKYQIQSADFVQGLRAKRSQYPSLRERLRLQWQIASRKVVLRSLTPPP